MLNAHCDHLPIYWDQVLPGADDSTSGVAVLLDMAQRLPEQGGLDRVLALEEAMA